MKVSRKGFRGCQSALAMSVISVALVACSKAEQEAPAEAPASVVAQSNSEQAGAQVPTNVAYVSSQDGHVTVYSLADYSVQKVYQVGDGGRGLSLTDDGKLLVVAVQDAGDLAIVDTASGEVVRRVYVGENPEFVRLLGNLAFVAYEPEATGGPPPKPGTPEFEALKAERSDDIEEDPAQVAVVDILKGVKIKEITAGVETEGIEFSADGKHIIVTNESDENVSVHDIETGQTVTRIDTSGYGIRPRGVKRSPAGDEFAVTLEYGNKIIFLNKEYEVTRQVDTGEVPYGVTYSQDGSEIVVALARGKTIQVFDSNTLELKREMPVGTRCWHFSYTPDQAQLWVACGRSDEVLVIDSQTGEKIKSLPDDKMPWGVVVYPKAAGSLEKPI